jgi:TRAP-type mannitol/chloroaromatic compound transport system permease small subunit
MLNLPRFYQAAGAVNGWLDRRTVVASLLVLPMSLLLCAQWPLRDLLGAGSRPANDLAQWIFALYVAVALRHATRVRGHICAGMSAGAGASTSSVKLRQWGQLLCLAPWAGFVLASAAPMIWQSLHGLERFPDTFSPLYFLVKIAVGLMALLMLLQALLDVLPAAEANPG